MNSNTKLFLSLIVLSILGAGSFDYLGPDRVRTTYSMQRKECYYTADGTYGLTPYGCHVSLYTDPSSSCPSSAAGYFNPGPCGWPVYVTCASMGGCSYGGPSASIIGCSAGETGCRSEAQVTTYPEANVSANILCSTPGSAGWCRGAASLEINSSEPVPGFNILTVEGTRNGASFACTGTTCSVALEEGVNAFTFWALSSWGDSSGMGTANGSVDTQPPYIDGSLSGIAGSGGWFISTVEVSASASDATSGVGSIVYSLDGGAQAAYTGPFSVGDGTHSIVFIATDVAGNSSSQTINVNVDQGLPSLAIDPASGMAGSGGWFISSATVSASASDGMSGLASLEYSIDGGGSTPYAGPVTLGDGSHTIVFTATDGAGNSVSGSSTVNVDTQAPQLALTGVTSFCPGCSGTMAIDYSVGDTGSGVTVWTMLVDGITLTSGSASETGTYDWDGSGLAAGAHTVTLVARDLAGNLTQTELLVTILIPNPIDTPALWYDPHYIIPNPQATATRTPRPTATSQSNNKQATDSSNSPATGPTATRTSAVVAFNNQDDSGSDLIFTNPASTTVAFDSSNVLWGAAAAAVIGASTAYALDQRRKRKEEEIREAEKAWYLNQELENLDNQRLVEYQNRKNFEKMLDAAETVGVSEEKLAEYRELYRQNKFDELNKAVQADMKVAIDVSLPNLLMAAEHSEEAKKYIEENILCYSEGHVDGLIYSNLTPEARDAARYSSEAKKWIEDPEDEFKNLKGLQRDALRQRLLELDAWAEPKISLMLEDARKMGTSPEKMAVLERLSETMSAYEAYKVLLNNNLELLPAYLDNLEYLNNRQMISILPQEFGSAASHSPEAAKWIADNLEKLWDQYQEDLVSRAQLELEKARDKDIFLQAWNWFGNNLLKPVVDLWNNNLSVKILAPSLAFTALVVYPWYADVMNKPEVFDNARSQFYQQMSMVVKEHPALITSKSIFDNPLEIALGMMDYGAAFYSSIASYADAAFQQSIVIEAIANNLRLDGISKCPEWLGESLWRTCASSYFLQASIVENPFDTAYGVAEGIVITPLKGAAELAAWGLQNNPISEWSDFSSGVADYYKRHFEELGIVLQGPEEQSALIFGLFILLTIINPIVGFVAGAGAFGVQTASGGKALLDQILTAPNRPEAMKIASSKQARVFVATSLLVLALMTGAAVKTGLEVKSFVDSLSPRSLEAFSDLSLPKQFEFFNSAKAAKITPEGIEFYFDEINKGGSALEKMPISDAFKICDLAKRSGQEVYVRNYLTQYANDNSALMALRDISPEGLNFYVGDISTPDSILRILDVKDAFKVSDLAVKSGKSEFVLDYVSKFASDSEAMTVLKRSSPDSIKIFVDNIEVPNSKWAKFSVQDGLRLANMAETVGIDAIQPLLNADILPKDWKTYLPDKYRDNVVPAFSGSPMAFKLNEPLRVYRYWGPDGEYTSPYFSLDPTMDPAIARSLLALPDYNLATNLTEFIIPKDAIIIFGDISPQPGFGDYAIGGGIQIYLPDKASAIIIKRIK